jgi:hypothetical protein
MRTYHHPFDVTQSNLQHDAYTSSDCMRPYGSTIYWPINKHQRSTPALQLPGCVFSGSMHKKGTISLLYTAAGNDSTGNSRIAATTDNVYAYLERILENGNDPTGKSRIAATSSPTLAGCG